MRYALYLLLLFAISALQLLRWLWHPNSHFVHVDVRQARTTGNNTSLSGSVAPRGANASLSSTASGFSSDSRGQANASPSGAASGGSREANTSLSGAASGSSRQADASLSDAAPGIRLPANTSLSGATTGTRLRANASLSGAAPSVPRRGEWPDGYFALCVAVKDQAEDMREYVEYYRWIGTGKIYVYDNNSTQPLLPVLMPYINEGLVEYSFFSRKESALADIFSAAQPAIYYDCIRRFRHRHRFMAFFDSDEFLVLTAPNSTARAAAAAVSGAVGTGGEGAGHGLSVPGHTSGSRLGVPGHSNETGVAAWRPDVNSFLKPYEPYGGLGVSWVMFGSSGHQVRPRGGVLLNFVECSRGLRNANRHVKVIANTLHVAYMGWSPHNFEYLPTKNKKFTVNEHFERLTGPFNTRVTWDKVALHHYAVKSRQQYDGKRKRGSAAGRHKGQKFWIETEKQSTSHCPELVPAALACCPSNRAELALAPAPLALALGLAAQTAAQRPVAEAMAQRPVAEAMAQGTVAQATAIAALPRQRDRKTSSPSLALGALPALLKRAAGVLPLPHEHDNVTGSRSEAGKVPSPGGGAKLPLVSRRERNEQGENAVFFGERAGGVASLRHQGAAASAHLRGGSAAHLQQGAAPSAQLHGWPAAHLRQGAAASAQLHEGAASDLQQGAAASEQLHGGPASQVQQGAAASD